MPIENLPTDSPDQFDDGSSGNLPQGAATIRHRDQPRLSILHLMAWTAASAVMMAVMQVPNEVADHLSVSETAYRIGMAMYGGIAICGVMLWIAQLARGVSFPTEPGEWLLRVQGLTVLVCVLVSVMYRWAGIEGDIFPIFLLLVVFPLIGFLPVMRYREVDAWSLFFRMFAATYAIPIFAMVGGKISLVRPIVSILLLLTVFFTAIIFCVAVGIDYRHGIRRSWVHWLGVGSLFLFVCVHLVLAILIFTHI